MTQRKAMQYRVRSADGNELVVPSLAVLHQLYDHGFLGDDDLVRAETASRWERAGSLPALQGVRVRKRDPKIFLILVTAAVALTAGIVLLTRLL